MDKKEKPKKLTKKEIQALIAKKKKLLKGLVTKG